MISRKQFLKSTSGALALAATGPLMNALEGCAPSAFAINARVTENKVIIPITSIPDLTQPNAYVKIYVDAYKDPFLLYYQESGEAIAILSTCSHKGCEVRKLQTRLECPCHGSEYDLNGNVIIGPASRELERFSVREFPDRLEFSVR